MKKPFYQMNKNENSAELLIYGDITSYKWFEDDVCAYDLAKELKELDGIDLTVRINSYGGEVAQGLAIYNLLKSYEGNVTTLCDGFACSAASVIFMAGQKRRMPKSSLLMIHNAWSYASGDANALRKQADDLEKITKPSIEIYKSVSNLDEETIKTMMDEETWITAEEAFEYGFATSVENEANQSLSNEMLSKLVHRTKELEKQLNTLQPTNSKDNFKENKNGWFF